MLLLVSVKLGLDLGGVLADRGRRVADAKVLAANDHGLSDVSEGPGDRMILLEEDPAHLEVRILFQLGRPVDRTDGDAVRYREFCPLLLRSGRHDLGNGVQEARLAAPVEFVIVRAAFCAQVGSSDTVTEGIPEPPFGAGDADELAVARLIEVVFRAGTARAAAALAAAVFQA